MFDWKFYIFLYPELVKKYNLKNKDTAYKHWIYNGRYEGRIGYHIDKDIFNWKEYLKNNKYLIKEGIRDKREAILHWYNVGKNLGLQISKSQGLKENNLRNMIEYENFSKNLDINSNKDYNIKNKQAKLIINNNSQDIFSIKKISNLKNYSNEKKNKLEINKLKCVTKDNIPKISHNLKKNNTIELEKITYTNHNIHNNETIISDLISRDNTNYKTTPEPQKILDNIQSEKSNLNEISEDNKIDHKIIELSSNNIESKKNLDEISEKNSALGDKITEVLSSKIDSEKNKLNKISKDKKSISIKITNYFNISDNKSNNSLLVDNDNTESHKKVIKTLKKNELDLIINKNNEKIFKSKNIICNEPKINYFRKYTNKIEQEELDKNFIENYESTLSNKNIIIQENIEKFIENYDIKLVRVNAIIKYRYENTVHLLNTLNYYKDVKNIILFIYNLDESTKELAKYYNVSIEYIEKFDNIINNSNNISFYGEINNNILIDKLFFENNQYNYAYEYRKNDIINYIYPVEVLEKKKCINDKNIFIEIFLSNIFKNINFDCKQIEHNVLINKFKNNSFEKVIYDIVDNIYILNLDRRIDRYNNLVKRLNDIDINYFEQFYAIDGNIKIMNILYNYYSNIPYLEKEIEIRRKFISSSGSLAILFSMKNMLNDAIKYKYKKILVLQDDIFFINNFFDILKYDLEAIKNINWKLLYLGANDRNLRYQKKNIINDKKYKYYYAEGNVDGAFGVMIDHSIFHELLEEIDKFILPFDSGPLKTIQKKYLKECIVLFPNLIIADVTESDCRMARNQQLFSENLLWNLNDYRILYNQENYPILTLIIYDINEIYDDNILNEISNLYSKYIENNYLLNIIILSSTVEENYNINNIIIIKIKDINDYYKNINLGILMANTKYIKIINLDDINTKFNDLYYFFKNKYFEVEYEIYYEIDCINIYNCIFFKKNYIFTDGKNLEDKFLHLKQNNNSQFISNYENNIDTVNII
tara:strand:- start:1527 stop:4499 length:2973 start_codon:yes stop_codon:yes gene_type:complete